MSDENERSVASAGCVALRASEDPDRMLAARLHGIADHSMAIIIGNMIQEMITELQMRRSPGHPGHSSFTLTDAEREALARLSFLLSQHGWAEDGVVLRGLLERLG